MFDLYTGNVKHLPHKAALPILVSSSLQGTALAALVLMSFLLVTRELPAVPNVLAFVAELPAAAPPVFGPIVSRVSSAEFSRRSRRRLAVRSSSGLALLGSPSSSAGSNGRRRSRPER